MMTPDDITATSRLEAHCLIHARGCAAMADSLERQANLAVLAFMHVEPDIVDVITRLRSLSLKAHKLAQHYQELEARGKAEQREKRDGK